MIADHDKPPLLAPLSQAHLLLVDIGNSRVAIAAWTGGKRHQAKHLAAEPFSPVGGLIERMWNDLPGPGKRAMVVSSVCPPVLAELQSFCRLHDIGPVLVVGQDIDPPIEADVPEPHKVGTDRLCAAAAGFDKVKAACVVADFGTALTIDLVADNDVFLGGTIMPGVALAARALNEHTAQLPLVEVGTPNQTFGKDTASAIRNGIFAMMVGALREVTERYATQIGKWPILIVTGGDAQAIASACEFVDHVAPDLCLDGLVIAYRNAAGESADVE